MSNRIQRLKCIKSNFAVIKKRSNKETFLFDNEILFYYSHYYLSLEKTKKREESLISDL